MAGIVDYASLKTSITNWTHRADLATDVDTMIQMVENELNRELRTRAMDTVVVINTTGSNLPLPSDYQQARNVELQGSPVIPLRYVTPEQRDLYDLQTSVGQPRLYTIRGQNLILAPTPDQIYQCNFEYYAQIPTLVGGANTTNWLLNSFPDCYLFGCLVMSLGWAQNPLAEKWVQMYEKVKSDVNRIDDDSTYAGSVVRLRPDQGW